MKNLQGRSAILDVHAADSTKKELDVEIQSKDAGAGAKGARHNSSRLDAHILKPVTIQRIFPTAMLYSLQKMM